MCEGIELDAADSIDTSSGIGLAARQRADAKHELGKMERLAEIVVGAEAEPGDPIRGCVRRRQHQDHRALLALDDHVAERVPVDSWQIAIKDDDLVLVDVEFDGCIATVVATSTAMPWSRSPRR